MGPSQEERQRLREERRQRIRRSEQRQIIWPIIGAFAVIVGLAVLLVALPGDAGNNIVVFLMFLCPMAVILYAVYVAMMLFVLGLHKTNAPTYRGLEKANELAETVRGAALRTSRAVNEQSIRFNAAVAPATNAMQAVVDPERAQPTKTDKTNDSPTSVR